MSRGDWTRVETLRENRNRLISSLKRPYSAATARHRHIMDYIAIHHPKYAAAFRVPKSTDGTEIVGRVARQSDQIIFLTVGSKGKIQVY